jgi:biopolymer transport protein ExbD
MALRERKMEREELMKTSRRDFVKVSTAVGMFGITETASATAANAKAKIGFVVSTKDHPDHLLCFLNGLQAGQWGTSTNPVKFFWASADGKYGSTHLELYNHALKHIEVHQVDTIVAAGGLPSAIAVAQAIAKYVSDHNNKGGVPFSFLIGRTPLSGEAEGADLYGRNFKTGGVDQNVPAQNENNYAQLNSNYNTVTVDTVGLIVNNNSPMSVPEIAAWKQANHQDKFIFQADANTENADQMSNIFNKIKNAKEKPTGIVVSSDPYFRSFGPDFEKQLRDQNGGNFKGYVCYPYSEYQDPANNNSIVSASTPKLAADVELDDNSTIVNTAYYQLGLSTSKVLQALSTNPNAFPQVATVTWTWDSSSGTGKWA